MERQSDGEFGSEKWMGSGESSSLRNARRLYDLFKAAVRRA